MREAVFSALAAWNGTADVPADEQLAGQGFCDLFAGSGAVALEAASRGAEPVVAVDRDHAACRVMRTNAASTRLPVRVVNQQVAAYLGSVPRRFDIVWFDPPYDLDDDVLDALVSDAADRALGDDGLLVVERSARGREPLFPAGFESWRAGYGETVVHYAQRAASQPAVDSTELQ